MSIIFFYNKKESMITLFSESLIFISFVNFTDLLHNKDRCSISYFFNWTRWQLNLFQISLAKRATSLLAGLPSSEQQTTVVNFENLTGFASMVTLDFLLFLCLGPAVYCILYARMRGEKKVFH